LFDDLLFDYRLVNYQYRVACSKTSTHQSGGYFMSEIGLSYKADVIPLPINVFFTLGFSNTTLKATVEQIQDFMIVLTPSGNISEQVLSGVAYPLAQMLGLTLPQLTKNFINGYSYDAFTISASTYEIGSESITITPSELNLSDYDDMLLVQGQLQMS
jgi:hypothetical protein